MAETDTVMERGLSLLKDTLQFTAEGDLPNPADREEIAKQLVHLQERYDLSQVGIANFHLRRISDLAQKMMALEDDLFDEDGKISPDVPYDVRLKIWQELNKQFHLSSTFVDAKASNPTMTSPERMERVASNPDGDDEKVKTLTPKSRRKVMLMMRRLLADGAVDAEVGV